MGKKKRTPEEEAVDGQRLAVDRSVPIPVLLHTAQDRNVEWERRRGRQKKQWMDNVRQWTGLSIYQSCSTQYKTGTLNREEEEDARRSSELTTSGSGPA